MYKAMAQILLAMMTPPYEQNIFNKDLKKQPPDSVIIFSMTSFSYVSTSKV